MKNTLRKKLLLFTLVGLMGTTTIPATAFANESDGSAEPAASSEPETNLYNWANEILPGQDFSQEAFEEAMQAREGSQYLEDLDQLLQALAEGIKTDEDQTYYNQVVELTKKLKNLHGQLDSMNTSMEAVDNAEQEADNAENEKKASADTEAEPEENDASNEQEETAEAAASDEQTEKETEETAALDEQVATDTVGTVSAEEQIKNLISGTQLEDIDSLIQSVDETTVLTMIDGTVSKGYLTVDGENLKRGIAADLIAAVCAESVMDTDAALSDAAALTKVLCEQGMMVASYQAPDLQAEEKPEETPMTAEEKKELFPENGFLSGCTEAATGGNVFGYKKLSHENIKEYEKQLIGGSMMDNLGELIKGEEKDKVPSFGSGISMGIPEMGTRSSSFLQNFKGELSDYLTSLLKAGGTSVSEKRKSLVASKSTDSTQFDKSSISKDGSKLRIVRRERKTIDDNSMDVDALIGNSSNIYPGCIVRANSDLADGHPTVVGGLDRNKISIISSLQNTTAQTIAPSLKNADKAQKDQIQQFKDGNGKVTVDNSNINLTGNSASKSVVTRVCDVSSENQLDAKLGVKGAAEKWGVDVSACQKGEKQIRLITLRQIYYTEGVEAQTADEIYADTVTKEDLAKKFNAEDGDENLAGAMVTQVAYGRAIVIKMETSSSSLDVKAAWNASMNGNDVTNNNTYKDIMKNTSFDVYVYGGSASASGELIKCSDPKQVMDIIAKDCVYDGSFEAVPISYTTTFLDDCVQCNINRCADYVETTVEEKDKTRITIDTAAAYCYNHQRLYGRKITGIDEKTGEIKLGKWEVIYSKENGADWSKDVDPEYAEFAYGFDIFWGTSWPYSGQFWDIKKGSANDIKIDMSGTCRMANIKFIVNGKEVENIRNCDSHSEWNYQAANEKLGFKEETSKG